MARALEVLDATLRKIEQGEINSIEALDHLLVEELTLRENRRVKAALMWARLSAIKTLAGFDFALQPSLDRSRVLALAELKFIDRAEVVHLLGPPGTGKSHLATALAVEAVKAGRSGLLLHARRHHRLAGPRPSGMSNCATEFAISAERPCSWSTRSGISRSRQAAPTCSSSA
jgi:DNA replication protein DnaC